MIKFVINDGTEHSNKCRHSVYGILWKKLVSALQCEKKKGHISAVCRSTFIVLWYHCSRWEKLWSFVQESHCRGCIVQMNQTVVEIECGSRIIKSWKFCKLFDDFFSQPVALMA